VDVDTRHIALKGWFLLLAGSGALARAELRPGLPAWVKVSAVIGARADVDAAGNFDNQSTTYGALEHLRLQWELRPRSWLTLSTEVHDARSLGFGADELSSFSNEVDVRQAWLQLGDTEGSLSLRAGRQELAFGDERLLGADGYWDNLGRTFDAARLNLRHGRWTVASFAALVNTPRHNRWDTTRADESLYGVYASFRHDAGVVEPYLLYSLRAANDDCGGHDFRTYGVRAAGDAPANLDYNVEVAVQSGVAHSERVRAWSGHWEAGYRLTGGDRAPRLALEYNYASGDADANDGRRGTFYDLYPAGYNKYGMTDPFAARNLRNLAADFEWELTGKWTLHGGLRRFWLATTKDSLYTTGEDFLVCNRQATNSTVGAQALASADYQVSARMRLHAGIARFLPGPYLQQSDFKGRWTTPYLAWTYRF
jgi:hypothetical protein